MTYNSSIPSENGMKVFATAPCMVETASSSLFSNDWYPFCGASSWLPSSLFFLIGTGFIYRCTEIIQKYSTILNLVWCSTGIT